MKQLTQKWLDRWFVVVVAFKGIDGGLEILAAAVLLLVPNASIHGLISHLVTLDAASDSDLLVHSLQRFSHSLTPGTQLYAAVYFLLHGVIKVGLVAALLSRRYRLYPAAIVVLVLFMIYQIYRISTGESLALDITLTVIDAVVVWLTWLEYRRHTIMAANGGPKIEEN